MLYLEELGGAPKEKEKTTDMIRSGKLLRKRYGRVYMNVGEPILLKSYLAAQEKPLEEMTVAERAFARMQSDSTSGTKSALTAITARSIGSGISEMLR